MKASLVLMVLAATVLAVSAYCPNLCSGHGSCGAQDQCTCYTQRGTDGGGVDSARVAWTGPDCSLRVCPVAPSFSGATPPGHTESATLASATAGDYRVTLSSASSNGHNDDATLAGQIKSGSEVRIQPTTGDAGFTMTVMSFTNSGTNGDTSTVQFFDPIPTNVASGWKIYFQPRSSAPTNTLEDPDLVYGVHAKLECAGKGICDRVTGTCECFPGYEGESCTRTVCPNSCSGHGVCLSMRRLATDAHDEFESIIDNANDNYPSSGSFPSIYNGWDTDKEYGCLCDSGFRGPACDQIECPSEFDPMWGCGGGTCNAYTATNDIRLDKNQVTYAAASYDITPVYAACASITQCSGNEQRDCSGRGICDYTTGLCQCFSGFYGEACQTQTILV